MRRYEYRTVEAKQLFETVATCDGCGVDELNTDIGRLIPVAVEIDYGENYGTRDEYDYCNDCLVAKASTLAAAGARSSLVNDPPLLLPCPACGEDHEPPLHEEI